MTESVYVYVLLLDIPYESPLILGVFSTKEHAEEAKVQDIEINFKKDVLHQKNGEYVITEFILDSLYE